SLFIAASIILFVTPHSIYSTSFILSFIATFVLIILPSFLTFEDYYHKPKYVKKLNNIVNSVFTTVMISLFIALTLYSRFQNFSLITPLANLIASMPFTIIMYISLFCVIFSPIYLPDFIIKFVSFIINGFHSILRYIANIKGIIIVPRKNLLIIICLFILICVIAAFFFKRKNRNNCFRVISILFIISITVNVFSSWISRNNYNQIIFSKEADSAIIIKGGKVNYIVENENSINADFLLSNGIIDISTLTFDNISNIEKAKEKLQSFNNTNKSDIVYCKEDLSEAKYTENISFDEYNITFAKKENENGLKLYYEGDKNILWLGNDAKRENNYKNVDILVLSESFFKNKYNIKALPTVASEIYFPYKYIDSYSIKYLKKNMPDAKLYSIKEFKYIEKNK
ncbi:MAG: ComEC/Rec2 family competence protein, partial [Clostridia bacterium]|nr:ComEC/Rec2 family competence protein [Clostridia bacterium]